MFKGSLFVSVVLGALVGAGMVTQVLIGPHFGSVPATLQPEVDLNVRPMRFVEPAKPVAKKTVVAKASPPKKLKSRTTKRRRLARRPVRLRKENWSQEERSIASLVSSGLGGR
jgi:hypothetical protein